MDITKSKGLKGEVTVPGDKSITHRAVMFGSISEGLTEVTDYLDSADCRSTMKAFKAMGVDIEVTDSKVLVHGVGLYGLKEPSETLDMGNSGTTTRLISGIMSGQKFASVLSGDESLNSRPMKRVIEPLQLMGANITSINQNGCAPLSIKPAILHGINYVSPVASAQVKSCLMLAGLYADDKTTVTEPALSRNHTELMINGFGGSIVSEGLSCTVTPSPTLIGQKVPVPGDISSAAYFIAAGLIVSNSEILIKNVGVNPTRAGILHVAKAMGGNITELNQRLVSGEPVSDLLVRSSNLKGTVIEGDIIPTLIDELPVIAVMAAFAEGTTIIKDAAELKVKESNRIDATALPLKAMGADITPTDDGFIINGGKALSGTVVDTKLDHRIAMSFAIAGLASEGTTSLLNSDCVRISYPGFYDDLKRLSV